MSLGSTLNRISFSKIAAAGALAALVLSLGMAFASSANAQTPPAVFYGKGLAAGARVEAFIGGRSCGSATVNAAGEWSIQVAADAACAPAAGAAVTFTLNGATAVATPPAVWQGGGLPPDVANGYVLTVVVATATATPVATVAPPKTGNAGFLGGTEDNTAGWVVLAFGLLALGAVSGARALRPGARS
jgi:hypothetical protein